MVTSRGDRGVARRYARALLDQADGQGLSDQISQDLAELEKIIATSRELRQFLASPFIRREVKYGIVTALFKGRVSGLTLRFLHLLVGHERENLLPAIIQTFQHKRDERRGILAVEVISSVALSEAQQERLISRLVQFTGKRIHLSARTDAALVGGFMVRIGDTIIDGTVRRQLERLRAQLNPRALVAV